MTHIIRKIDERTMKEVAIMTRSQRHWARFAAEEFILEHEGERGYASDIKRARMLIDLLRGE